MWIYRYDWKYKDSEELLGVQVNIAMIKVTMTTDWDLNEYQVNFV